MKSEFRSAHFAVESHNRMTWPECFVVTTMLWMSYSMLAVIVHAQLTNDPRYLQEIVELSIEGMRDIKNFVTQFRL